MVQGAFRIITPECLPIPVERLMFSEHGRIDVALALVHSDVNTNISTYVNFLVPSTSETKEETTSLVISFSLSPLTF